MLTDLPLDSQHIGRGLSGFDGGENPAKVILGRRLKAYKEAEIEAAKTDGGAVVSSVSSIMDQDLVDLPVLRVSGQQHPFI